MDLIIAGSIALSVVLWILSGVAMYQRRDSGVIWTVYFAIILTILVFFLTWQKRVLEKPASIAESKTEEFTTVKPAPEKSQNERAVMTFTRTDVPAVTDPNQSFDTVFWFRNTGDITARNVTVSEVEILVMAPDLSFCNRSVHRYGGPREVGRAQDYQIPVVLTGFMLQRYIVQVRFTLEYIAATDVYGTTIKDSVIFCEESQPIGNGGKVRWFSCTDKPYPKCEKTEDM